jgi:hypothetical protein
MGKAKRDRTTPKQPTTIGRLPNYTPEQRARALEKMVVAPELRDAIRKMLPNYTPEQLAKLDKAGKVIRDGLIPPPWAEGPLKPASERKAKAKSKSKKKRRRPQVDRAILILIELYRPTGIPPDNTLLKTSHADVNRVIKERNKVLPEDRKEPLIPPDSVRRAILVLKERNAP